MAKAPKKSQSSERAPKKQDHQPYTSHEAQIFEAWKLTTGYTKADGSQDFWLACEPCGDTGHNLGCKLCMDRRLVPESFLKSVRGSKHFALGKWNARERKSNVSADVFNEHVSCGTHQHALRMLKQPVLNFFRSPSGSQASPPSATPGTEEAEPREDATQVPPVPASWGDALPSPANPADQEVTTEAPAMQTMSLRQRWRLTIMTVFLALSFMISHQQWIVMLQGHRFAGQDVLDDHDSDTCFKEFKKDTRDALEKEKLERLRRSPIYGIAIDEKDNFSNLVISSVDPEGALHSPVQTR